MSHCKPYNFRKTKRFLSGVLRLHLFPTVLTNDVSSSHLKFLLRRNVFLSFLVCRLDGTSNVTLAAKKCVQAIMHSLMKAIFTTGRNFLFRDGFPFRFDVFLLYVGALKCLDTPNRLQRHAGVHFGRNVNDSLRISTDMLHHVRCRMHLFLRFNTILPLFQPENTVEKCLKFSVVNHHADVCDVDPQQYGSFPYLDLLVVEESYQNTETYGIASGVTSQRPPCQWYRLFGADCTCPDHEEDVKHR
mmetsp:Transcript_13456/g.27238  ORF Transcript_13456/g.27238 Transcript_13456/m.27238 type:complete len:245 (+) Transcript_13456:933-1667(+)